MSQLAIFQKWALEKTEKEMLCFISEQTGQKDLASSMLYSVEAGGKRVRPLLLLATVASFNQEVTFSCIQVAAALEMLHTYSLIHDDLPAMDDDDLRRGKPTNHKVYGEGMAILAGDGLLTLSFQLLSQAQLPFDQKILLIQQFAQAAGPKGMIAGQAADILGEGQTLDLVALKQIHAHKTGDLIRFAFKAGGILAKQTEETVAILDEIAQHLGLAFQIRDDLLDIVSTTEALGKQTQKDHLLEKNTYPALLGLDGAKQALENELTAAKKQLEQLKTNEFDFHLLEEVIQLFSLAKGV